MNFKRRAPVDRSSTSSRDTAIASCLLLLRHRVFRARSTLARAKAFSPHGSDTDVMVDSEMPKSEGEFGKPASCWNLEYACPRPETDFCLTPRPRNSVRAVECGEDGSPALTSCLSESEHIGMLNYTIQNGSALPQSHRPSRSLETPCKY
mgnify:CR=1 FL=1